MTVKNVGGSLWWCEFNTMSEDVRELIKKALLERQASLFKCLFDNIVHA